jgi:hypothetical protein
MFLIGSRAADYWTNRKFYRPVKDWDIVGTFSEFNEFNRLLDGKIASCYPSSDHKFQIRMKNGDRIEFEMMEPDTSNSLLDQVCSVKRRHFGKMYYDTSVELRVVPHVVLYLIKRSHIYWPVHWKKNIQDLHWLKEQIKNEVLESVDRNFYARRVIENANKFGPLFEAKLATDNDRFFNRSQKKVKRYYLHDDLHSVVKFGIRPVYEMAKNDPTKAIMDKGIFSKLPENMQNWAVQEEAAVIALERKIIPLLMGHNIEPTKERIQGAYDWALMRICTNLTSGWFRDFAINSWPVTRYSGQDFFTKFTDAVREERIKAIDQSEIIDV